MKIHVYYNPKSNNGQGKTGADSIKSFYPGEEILFRDITEVESYKKLFEELEDEDRFIICGGDGTLHRFINDTDGMEYNRDIYYYASGTGNDFLNDLNKKQSDGPFVINEYIKNLPIVTVNGRERRFLNNVGYGIDGYCCEVADLQRETSRKKINYKWIAFKGVLGGYHPANAVVIVDGVKKTYKNVWLAPSMKGRFCGGGMMLAPRQDRMNPDRTVSCAVMYNAGKLTALTRFTNVSHGKHEKYKDMVEIIEGHEIQVTFDSPCALQIDGETVLGVLQYSVRADV